MTDLAPEPLDPFSAVCAAIHALAVEAHEDWHNDYVAERIEGLIPKPRRGDA